MQHATQAVTAQGRFSRRAMGLLFAGLLQAGFVWALVVGLEVKDLVKPFTGPIQTFFPEKTIKPVEPPPPVNQQVPVVPVVPIPPFDIARPEGDGAITAGPARPTAPTTGPADHGPVSVAATHTIPPYPALDIRLGNQGTVLLRLLIGTDGRVLDAKVVRSSGSDSLDRAAQAWVIGHWRYQSAIHGGVAVQGAVDVAVKFDLRNAG